MTKKVLISIHPKWCEKIFSGEKTIEVRKSAPKLKPPFEVLVYMTKPKKRLIEIIKDGDYIYGDIYHGKMLFIKMDRPVYDKNWNDVAGKVIGSFVCRGIMRPNDNLQTMANYMNIQTENIFTDGVLPSRSCLIIRENFRGLGNIKPSGLRCTEGTKLYFIR